MKKIIYIDMDGTVVNFKSGIDELTEIEAGHLRRTRPQAGVATAARDELRAESEKAGTLLLQLSSSCE